MSPAAGPPRPTSMPRPGPRVVADIGGTHARFATIGAEPQQLVGIECLQCSDYGTLEEAVVDYTKLRGIGKLEKLGLAVAGPVDRDLVDLPNNPWRFSRSELARALDTNVDVVNDFAAQAGCLDALRPSDVTWLGAPRPRRKGVRAVLGPGTGLGVAVLMPDGDLLPSEGGHVAFAPTNPHEIELLRHLMSRFGRVSAERLLSGPGLENLYWANQQIDGVGSDVARMPAPEINRRAREGEPLALRAVEDFFDALAGYAGDVALFAWSTGGVYLSGGVLRKLSAFLDPDRFRARFQDKGRFAPFFGRMPVGWINHPYPGLLGCAALLARASGNAAAAPTAESPLTPW